MKKSALFLGFLLTLFCLVKCGNVHRCAVAKIENEFVFKPSWTGDCVNDSASGEGVLYDYFGYMKYKGGMKNGASDGFGVYFGDYLVEGNWSKGIPQSADYYLREVKFSAEYYHLFIENGLRFSMKDHKYSTEYYLENHFYADSLLSKIDSSNFVIRLEKETLYHPNVTQQSLMTFVDSVPCIEHVFYNGRQFSTGWNSSDSYHFFVVQCKNGNTRRFFEQKLSFKGSPDTFKWKMRDPVDSRYLKEFTSPFALMKQACGCE